MINYDKARLELTKKITSLVTHEVCNAYKQQDEKYLFCVDLLNRADLDGSTFAVKLFEDEIESYFQLISKK